MPEKTRGMIIARERDVENQLSRQCTTMRHLPDERRHRSLSRRETDDSRQSVRVVHDPLIKSKQSRDGEGRAVVNDEATAFDERMRAVEVLGVPVGVVPDSHKP